MGRGAPREVLGGNRDSGGSPSTATNFMISYEHELRPNHLTIFSAPRWPQRARNYLFSYLRLFRRDLWGTGGLGGPLVRHTQAINTIYMVIWRAGIELALININTNSRQYSCWVLPGLDSGSCLSGPVRSRV